MIMLKKKKHMFVSLYHIFLFNNIVPFSSQIVLQFITRKFIMLESTGTLAFYAYSYMSYNEGKLYRYDSNATLLWCPASGSFMFQTV